MMEAVGSRRADVHAGTLPDRVEAGQDGDLAGAVVSPAVDCRGILLESGGERTAAAVLVGSIGIRYCGPSNGRQRRRQELKGSDAWHCRSRAADRPITAAARRVRVVAWDALMVAFVCDSN